MKALKKVIFTIEVLCEPDANPESMELDDVMHECIHGDFSARHKSPVVTYLNLAQAHKACAEHGTDREFFQLPAYENGTKVWWTDPDDDASSGWYTIVDFCGETYQLKNDAGGECEALEHELSIAKPKKGKK